MLLFFVIIYLLIFFEINNLNLFNIFLYYLFLLLKSPKNNVFYFLFNIYYA